MRGRSALLITGVALAGALVASTPATAAPLDKGRFNEVFTVFFTCESTGTPVRHDADYWINFNVNQRGSSPFPYFRESVHGTDVFTNLDTGGTFTIVFSSNFKDHVITDNGDGTITILVIAAGGTRAYDTDGNFVLNDPGQIRFSFDVDYNGTPSDPSDDFDIPDSFQVVRDSTGRNDTEGRDFCEDLVEFTSEPNPSRHSATAWLTRAGRSTPRGTAGASSRSLPPARGAPRTPRSTAGGRGASEGQDVLAGSQ